MCNFIRELRGKMTQKEFADKVGITQASVSRYEKGDIPRIEVLKRIAEATGTELIIRFEQKATKREISENDGQITKKSKSKRRFECENRV